MKRDNSFRPWNWGARKYYNWTSKKSGNQYAGNHQFKDHYGNRHGAFKVIWFDGDTLETGWYWYELDNKGFPKPQIIGPFETSYMAYHDAVEKEA